MPDRGASCQALARHDGLIVDGPSVTSPGTVLRHERSHSPLNRNQASNRASELRISGSNRDIETAIKTSVAIEFI
jgi:hypothetical protein